MSDQERKCPDGRRYIVYDIYIAGSEASAGFENHIDDRDMELRNQPDGHVVVDSEKQVAQQLGRLGCHPRVGAAAAHIVAEKRFEVRIFRDMRGGPGHQQGPKGLPSPDGRRSERRQHLGHRGVVGNSPAEGVHREIVDPGPLLRRDPVLVAVIGRDVEHPLRRSVNRGDKSEIVAHQIATGLAHVGSHTLPQTGVVYHRPGQRPGKKNTRILVARGVGAPGNILFWRCGSGDVAPAGKPASTPEKSAEESVSSAQQMELVERLQRRFDSSQRFRILRGAPPEYLSGNPGTRPDRRITTSGGHEEAAVGAGNGIEYQSVRAVQVPDRLFEPHRLVMEGSRKKACGTKKDREEKCVY
ncbi:MAG: hypothetical protein BWY66_01458 [bacterium ADurb.Bin374]|nr:MAG: hypothetical protein BWY66_01458 [bacterium ADurb.Bin374]